MLLVLSYFSPLRFKNKPHDRDSKHALILGPVILVATVIYLTK